MYLSTVSTPQETFTGMIGTLAVYALLVRQMDRAGQGMDQRRRLGKQQRAPAILDAQVPIREAQMAQVLVPD